MAQKRGVSPTSETAPEPAPTARRRRRNGPTAFQRLRQAVVDGNGLTLTREEAGDLYWRGELAGKALDDDRAGRPSQRAPRRKKAPASAEQATLGHLGPEA